MDGMARRHIESRLTDARRQHTRAVAEVGRQLRELEDPEHSSAGWYNIARTVVEGVQAAGQVDAYLTALAADEADGN